MNKTYQILINVNDVLGENINTINKSTETLSDDSREVGLEVNTQERPSRSSVVRRWLPTAAARVHVRAACGVCGGQSGTGAGFLRVLRFPLSIIPPNSPLS
jgi:hypothetical protein